MVILPKITDFRRHTRIQSQFMVLFSNFRSIAFASLLVSSTAFGWLWQSAIAQAQELPSSDPSSEQPQGTDPSDLRPLTTGILSMAGAQQLMTDASAAVSSQNYDLAVSKLQEARQVYNQLSNFYQELAASFAGIDNRIAQGQRDQAIQSAQMRDQATYQLALVHRAQNQPELAVPLLIQIIRSQNPTRELGQQAYQQLFELGFVNSPFPRDGEDQSTSSVPR